jgi:phenylalanyl-tRNA synthetase beta chain
MHAAPGQMVISDEARAGIAGGHHGGRGFRLHRRNGHVFLESAYWDPITMAATGRALKINSDARYRFERGVDPAFTLPGLDLATQMILDLCGGEASDLVQDGAVPDTTRATASIPARVVSWWAWTSLKPSSAPRWRPGLHAAGRHGQPAQLAARYWATPT